MIRLLLLFTFISFQFNLQGGLWEDVKGWFLPDEKPLPPMIRVLIVHDVEKVNLEVRGKYSLFDPYTNEYMSTRLAGKSRDIEALNDGLKWGEAFPGLYQLKLRPDDPETVILINNKEYRGPIYVYDIGGTVSIVNEIPIEEYLASTLSQLDSLTLLPETWSSLVIVARTSAYFQAVNPKNTYWAVDAQKVNYEGAIIPRNPLIKHSLEVTKYMILSRTGIYDGVATPFAAQFGPLTANGKEIETSKISIEQADEMAKEGDHADQILSKAFPGTTIMLLKYSK